MSSIEKAVGQRVKHLRVAQKTEGWLTYKDTLITHCLEEVTKHDEHLGVAAFHKGSADRVLRYLPYLMGYYGFKSQ